MSQPYFMPWKRRGFNGTLIIGESCPKGNQTRGITGWNDHPDSEWPHHFIKKHVEVNRDPDSATFRKLRHGFLYDGRVLEAIEFWEQHAFTNLLPRLIERGKPIRAADWVAARDQLPLILAAVRPKRILIAGKWARDVLKDMSDTGSYVPFGATDGWEMRFDGVPAIGFYHPSYWNRVKPKRYTLDQARLATARLWRVTGTPILLQRVAKLLRA